MADENSAAQPLLDAPEPSAKPPPDDRAVVVDGRPTDPDACLPDPAPASAPTVAPAAAPPPCVEL